MDNQEKMESEGFRNQKLTAAAAVLTSRENQGPPRKKVVALQLDDREQFALGLLGGLDALKALLAPRSLCLACRATPPSEATPFGNLCLPCAHIHGSTGTQTEMLQEQR